jgi:hypothetical protein
VCFFSDLGASSSSIPTIDIIFLDKLIVAKAVKFLAFIKSRGSLPSSQQTAVIGSYPEPVESIPNLHALYL